MNILIIAPEQIPVPPLSGGSVEHTVFQIAKRLAENHKVTVVSRKHPHYPNIKKTHNLTIIRVSSGGYKSYISSALSAVRGKHFDIIQIDNRPRFAPMVKKVFPNSTVCVFLHSITYITPPMTTKPAAGQHLAKADVIIANSQSVAKKVAAFFPHVKHKVEHVWLGVDLKQFRPPTNEQKIRVRQQKKVHGSFNVVFAGRIIPRKGVPVLIKAVKLARASVPKAKLVVAGGGKRSYVSSLKRLASSLGVSARFLGRVSRRKMHEVYWLGDCFVCPSQGHEAFGLVNVEAMASGTPTIASRNGGIPEIIKHGKNGLLVGKYKEPRAFAESIARIAKLPSLAKRLAKQARYDAEQKFSWRATASQLANIYAKY